MKKMRIQLTMCLVLLAASFNVQAQADSTLPGLQVKVLASKILGEKRTLYIQAPSKMVSGERYPVLYLLDGEALVELAAGQVRYLSESYKIIPQMIVVGIANTDRFRDLTPTAAVMNGKTVGGGGDKFLSFLRDEVIPAIDSAYPTAPYRVLAGHSLGGLMAVHSLVHHPGYFNAFIAMSPSLQWDNNRMLTDVEKQLPSALDKKILHFSSGAEDSAFRANQLTMKKTLEAKQLKGLRFGYATYPAEAHTMMPVKALYDGLRLIFPNWFLPLNDASFKKSFTAATVKHHYDTLSAAYGFKVVPPHDEMMAIARFLRNDSTRNNSAIELLQVNAINYPASAINFETLGDTYLKLNDKQQALASYKKALALTPSNKKLESKIQSINN